MLLKAVTILKCSEPVVSAGIQASREVKDLGESIRHLKVKKLALEEAKEKLTFELGELKEASLSKDQRLEEKDQQLVKARSRISELEKSNAEAFDEIARLKADVEFIKQQWRDSAFEIKDNILAQCQVICPGAGFSEVSLEKRVVDWRIEVEPISEEGDDNPGNESTTLVADHQG